MSVKARRKYDIERDVRDKILVSRIINRLQGHILEGHEMSPTQIQAAQILLKKALPDLVYQESHNTHEHVFAEVPKTASMDEWKQLLVDRAGQRRPAPNLIS